MADDLKGKKMIFSELGVTGLRQYSGHVHEEFLKELQGKRAAETFQEMQSNDPIVGAIIFVIDLLLRGTEWVVNSVSDSPQDKEAADFVESCMEDMSISWEDQISEILSFLPFGWSYHEVVYKRRLGPKQKDPRIRSRYKDGRVGWRKMPIRSQDSLWKWEFDSTGGIQGMWQVAPPDYIMRFIPIEKSLLFRTQVQKGNPEGRSILRNAYRPWYFKKQIEEIEGIGIERDLAGLPMAWVPPELLSPDADAESKAVLEAIRKIVINVRRDEQEGIIFPLAYDENNNKMYDFSLLTSGGRRNFDTDAIISRYDQRIAMTSLADFILLGHEATGSFALSSSKTHMFAVAISAWQESIAGVFNRHAIPRLMDLNGFDLEEMPYLTTGEIQTPDLAEIGSYIQRLAGAGAPLFPDDELEGHLRRLAGMPVREHHRPRPLVEVEEPELRPAGGG